jgi:nitrate reductase beta subunit
MPEFDMPKEMGWLFEMSHDEDIRFIIMVPSPGLSTIQQEALQAGLAAACDDTFPERDDVRVSIQYVDAINVAGSPDIGPLVEVRV